MIYVVTTRREENAFMPDSRFADLERVFGDTLVKRVFADQSIKFDFIKPDDYVLVQTRDRFITDALLRTGARTTAESRETVNLTHDKEISKGILAA